MKLYQCVSVFKPSFLTNIFKIEQNSLAGKSFQLEFGKFYRNLKSNCKEVKACSFEKISSIMNENISILILCFILCFLHADSFLHIWLMEAKHTNSSKYPNVICLQCKCALGICFIPFSGMQTPCMSWSACVDYSYWYSIHVKNNIDALIFILCVPVWFWLACPKIVHITEGWAVVSHRGPLGRCFCL